MVRRITVLGSGSLFVLLALSASAQAQAPVAAIAATPPPAVTAPAAPALSELELAFVGQAQLASQLVNTQCAVIRAWAATDDVGQATAATACQALQSMAQFKAIKNQADQKIEAAHPGLTLDWSKIALVAKPAPPKP